MSNYKNIYVGYFIKDICDTLSITDRILTYSYDYVTHELTFNIDKKISLSKNNGIAIFANNYYYETIIKEITENSNIYEIKVDLELFPVTPINLSYKTLFPYYLHGTPLVISNILKEKDKTKKYSYQKYPLIALYEPFESLIDRNPENIIYSTQNLTIIFADKINFEEQANNPDSQYDNVISLLYDNYVQPFFNNIENHHLVFNKIVNYSQKIITNYGLETKYGNQGNIFPDWLAAIEISFDLQLKKEYICNINN